MQNPKLYHCRPGIRVSKRISILQRMTFISLALIVTSNAFSQSQTYPPLKSYMMDQTTEVALAKSAAPEHISAAATIRVLTENGYKTVADGTNGFVCLVARGWAAPSFTPTAYRQLVYDPKVLAPICFNPVAARTVLPYQDLRAALAMQGKGPDEITQEVESAYATGKLPKMDTVGFAYMYSMDMYLGSAVGHFHPHLMVYAPYYTNAMLGGNGRNTMLPRISDDEGTPFAVIIIPVDRADGVKSTIPLP